MSELVCWMAVPDTRAGEASRLRALLTPAEQERADRFRFATDRTAYVTAHGLLRAELGRRLGEAPERVEIVHDAMGKPGLAGPRAPALHFSISHSRRYVACAFSRVKVGVDIEQTDREIDPAVAKVLSGPERRHLDSLAPKDRTAAFLEIWTMKEAALKAYGTGLSTPLDGFSVCAASRCVRPGAGSPLPAARHWSVTLRHLGVGSVCSVARIGGGPHIPPIEFKEWLHQDFDLPQ
jgi:4'-phosphopantetheinyl transferase